ncbi:metal ABC transporter substrate-binding protein [Hydrogenophaga sp. 5NK40-0174]
MPVVASFSVLGDMVRAVGGDRVALTVLVGPGADAHVYQPRPSAVRAVQSAKVVFSVGLGFEGWLKRLLTSAGGSAISVEVANKDDHEGEREGEHEVEHDHEHDHGEVDPHAWQDVTHARHFVAAIAEGLCRADKTGCPVYRGNASRYDARLAALDKDIRAAWQGVVPERRKVITSHDAFGYYSAAYGVRFLSPQGVSTQSEASARDVATLIDQIKREKVKAVFVESLTDQRLIERIAKESGVVMSGSLYADTLSEADGPAPTYVDMMRYNTRVMVEAAR